MTQEWTVPAWAVAAAAAVALLLALAIGLAVVRLRAALRREVAAARVSAAALRDRLDLLERPAAPPAAGPGSPAHVITRLGDAEPTATAAAPAAARPVGGRLFADLVLRESVVQVAALAHGVRRALEQRDRIRSEVRREVRRSRKQRRADVRTALREHHARQRAALDDPAGSSDAGPAEGSAA